MRSSYCAYTGIVATPEWLQTKFVLTLLGKHQQRKLYRLFVEKGVDKETHIFYDKKKFSFVIGSDDFRKLICSKLPTNAEIPEIKKLRTELLFSSIVQVVSIVIATPEEQILQVVGGVERKT